MEITIPTSSYSRYFCCSTCSEATERITTIISFGLAKISSLKYIVVKPLDLLYHWTLLTGIEVGRSFKQIIEVVQMAKPIIYFADIGRHLGFLCNPLPFRTLYHFDPHSSAPEAGLWEQIAKKTSNFASLLLSSCNFTISLLKLDLIFLSEGCMLALRWIKPWSRLLISTYRIYEESVKIFFGHVVDVSSGQTRMMTRNDYFLSSLEITLNLFFLALSLWGLTSLFTALPYEQAVRLVLSTCVALLSCLNFFAKYFLQTE